MSRQKDEKQYVPKTRKSQEAPNAFVAFRPSEAQRTAIQAQNLTVGDCLEIFDFFLEAGHRVTLGHRAENDTYFVQIREGGSNWAEAVVLSCWHVQRDRCLQMLAYALTEVYPLFPDQVQLSLPSENW